MVWALPWNRHMLDLSVCADNCWHGEFDHTAQRWCIVAGKTSFSFITQLKWLKVTHIQCTSQTVMCFLAFTISVLTVTLCITSVLEHKVTNSVFDCMVVLSVRRSWFKTRMGPFSVECPPRACVGLSTFLLQSKNRSPRFTDHSGTHECVCGPAMHWGLEPLLYPSEGWDRLQQPWMGQSRNRGWISIASEDILITSYHFQTDLN